MIHPDTSPRLAVLIDAENINADYIAGILSTIAERFGNATILRAYGDWTTTQLMPWKKKIEGTGVRPVQQFRYVKGKNSSDGALIMDAMDMLHTRALDGICIVSSDSDYAGLAARIREAGLKVYGFGMPGTLKAFVGACDAFVFLERLAEGVARDANGVLG